MEKICDKFEPELNEFGNPDKHTCWRCKIGAVENCKNCHRDKCDNPNCEPTPPIK